METLEAASMNTTVSTKPAVLRSRTRCLAPASDALCFLLFNLSFFFLLITFKAALSATTYNLASLDARVESLEEEVANALGATDYFGNGNFADGAVAKRAYVLLCSCEEPPRGLLSFRVSLVHWPLPR